MNDNVNHPRHYNSHPSGVECIEITRHMTFTLGNAFKYVWRAELKNGQEDLKKAIWYLNDHVRLAAFGSPGRDQNLEHNTYHLLTQVMDREPNVKRKLVLHLIWLEQKLQEGQDAEKAIVRIAEWIAQEAAGP